MPEDIPPPAATLHDVAILLKALNDLVLDPNLQAQLGHGFVRELSYTSSTFRQRFPDCWPSLQPQLF